MSDERGPGVLSAVVAGFVGLLLAYVLLAGAIFLDECVLRTNVSHGLPDPVKELLEVILAPVIPLLRPLC